MAEGDILDANEVAKLLKISYRKVLRMAERGEITSFRVGDLWRFRREDVEAYISRQQWMPKDKEDR
jgi:nitrogen PTS system EIIA component